MQITTIGLDIAKRSFQIHGIDKTGAVVVAKALSRGRVLVFFSKLEPCLIGLEACASAHYWGRELGALGHQVHLIPPAYVKAYLRRNKNDAADAAAICEAVSRPHMRFVEVKSAAKQAARSLTRVREQLISQRTATVNSLRGHLAEFGIIEAAGLARARRLRAVIEDGTDRRLPDLARESLSILVEQIEGLDGKILDLDGRIAAWHKSNEVSQRLASIPGIGTLTAATFAQAVPNADFFRSGREFAAWLGLVPRQKSTGGKPRLGRISKRGDRRLRSLLVICASSVLQSLKRRKQGTAGAPWLARLMATKPPLVVAVALANKLARTIWAVMAHGQAYQPERGFLAA
ncbi:MAG: IS110 family transposase [Rhodospirillales bacterium]|jgi:transposase|nr:IS110 family transposase [Rhodospirillales bacterium]